MYDQVMTQIKDLYDELLNPQPSRSFYDHMMAQQASGQGNVNDNSDDPYQIKAGGKSGRGGRSKSGRPLSSKGTKSQEKKKKEMLSFRTKTEFLHSLYLMKMK